MEGNHTFSLWGKFRNQRLEKKYFLYATPEIQERNKIGILIAGISFFIIGFSDYYRVGYSQELFITLLLRTVIFLYSLLLFFLWKSPKKINHIYTHTILYSLFFGFFFNIIICQLNPDKVINLIDLFTLPISTLLMYVFLILHSRNLFIIGLVISGFYFFRITTFYDFDFDFTYTLGLILLTINTLGVYITRYLAVARRNEYLRILEIEKLNRGLQEENEERKSIQDKLIFTYSELTDSLRYANHLQMAMLPDPSILNKYFKEYFVFYKPCEIVSGDFYWFSAQKNKIVIAAADCTGHGIRAAFMSIVGITFLDDIVINKKITDAHEILNQLKEQVIKNLRQSGTQQTAHDGMDIAICVIDTKNMEMQYAGAYNPLVIIRNENLIEYKGDRMPISYYFAAKPSFTNHVIPLQENDRFYLFTDGYADQFGGQKNKKYTYRRLKRELLIHSQQSMDSQRDLLMNTHLAWKESYAQTDDIVFLGFKI